MPTEKRQFQRIMININGQLNWSNQIQCVQILDMSLQGVRVCLSDNITVDISQPLTVVFRPNEDSPSITLSGRITHVQHATDMQPPGTILGIKIAHISVEDLSELRRLLLLNSGQQDMDSDELMVLLDNIISQIQAQTQP